MAMSPACQGTIQLNKSLKFMADCKIKQLHTFLIFPGIPVK